MLKTNKTNFTRQISDLIAWTDNNNNYICINLKINLKYKSIYIRTVYKDYTFKGIYVQ